MNIAYLQETNAEINSMPLRSFYIPFSDYESAKTGKREESSRYISLCGDWEFKSYKDVNNLEEEELLNGKFDKTMPVPGCVQVHGEDYMQYVNVFFPFPFDPPYIMKENPVFCYRKTVDIDKKDDDDFYLVFEGVSSCYYLYCNGKFVGYSQVSHRMSEWKLTDYLQDGKNEIVVAVVKWCASSYLEDQDFWRISGIFREVYMLKRPLRCLLDYRITTGIRGKDGYITFENLRGADCEVCIEGEEKVCPEGKSVDFEIKDAKFWNAEEPNLYEIMIRCNGEYIPEKVGIREISKEGQVVKINGRRVKFKGICRHEFSPTECATVTREDTYRDLLLIKENNFNAIRTSHYQNIPDFYRFCDEIGLYVMAEADLETHGVICTKGGYDQDKFNIIAEDPMFNGGIVYRQKCNYELNKNRASVVIWSLGNESGYGKNFEDAADYLHSVDRTRLIQYEGITKVKPPLYYTDKLDLVSYMYPTPEWMDKEFPEDKQETRPLILCECAHSMGNGPGDISAYWDVILRHDEICGAFIWQFADSTMRASDGRMLYGGDYGEKLHDGPFITSGVFDAYRKEKRALLEHRATLQPVKTTEKDGKYYIRSILDFAELDGECTYKVKSRGEVKEQGKVAIRLKAGETQELKINHGEYDGYSAIYFDYKVYFGGRSYTSSASFTLKPYPHSENLSSGNVNYEREGRNIRIIAGDSVYTFDCLNGKIISAKRGGTEILNEPIELNIYRAPIDNDMCVVELWRKWGLDRAYQHARNVCVDKRDGALVIRADVYMVADYLRPILKAKQTVTFYGDGLVLVEEDYTISDFVEHMPRIGLKFALDKANYKVDYLGFGKAESYIDKCVGTRKDYYSDYSDNMFTDYIVPQENGSHNDTDFVSIARENGTAVTVEADREFSFSVQPYGIEALAKARHNWELGEREKTYVNLDAFMMGTGSASCGPALNIRYWLTEKTGSFRFYIRFE